MDRVTTNLNQLFKHLYHALESQLETAQTDLIYHVKNSVPKEVRGDERSLMNLLEPLLGVILEHYHGPELVITVDASSEFVFEELVSFSFSKTAPLCPIITQTAGRPDEGHRGSDRPLRY
jgi:replication-associated recombination protein RarA